MSDRLQILVGDCREKLRSLPDESVQMSVTSPPYWGLRDYGTATWEGGDGECGHRVRENPHIESSTLGGGKATVGHSREGFKVECPRCGARRVDAQIGQEATPEEFVSNLVSVFSEVWRVLQKDGVLWCNLGDSYASGGRGGGQDGSKQGSNKGALLGPKKAPPGYKSKDLIGIPWMVAFALRNAGWYLRRDIIWYKPNAMPESCVDRPAIAHEYLFLLSKSPSYYFDNDAIKEPASDAMLMEVEQGYDGLGLKDYEGAGVQNPSDVKSRIIANARKRSDQFGGNKHNGDTTKHSDGSVYTGKIMVNKRTVWTVPTAPFRGAHFATFPPALITPCILAGSKPGDVVLDPFGGSGTTGKVALELGRKAILCELNPEYVEIMKKRTDVTPGLGL